MSLFSQVSFMDPISPAMLEMIQFHDFAWVLMLFVLGVVFSCYLVTSIIPPLFTNKYYENQVLEVVWLICPIFLLGALALPSLRLLYSMEEVNDPLVTLKVVGHQWYWSYSYEDCGGPKEFDSYMIPMAELEVGTPRLLEVDHRVVLPYLSEVRVLVTAADVLHSWTVPSLGVKVDAVPGRLNQLGFQILKGGVYYGQCSELCGVNHSFMPICLEVVGWQDFFCWVCTSGEGTNFFCNPALGASDGGDNWDFGPENMPEGHGQELSERGVKKQSSEPAISGQPSKTSVKEGRSASN